MLRQVATKDWEDIDNAIGESFHFWSERLNKIWKIEDYGLLRAMEVTLFFSYLETYN